MHHLCKTTFHANLQCKMAANTYYWGVTEFGDSSFQESQLDYCQCVAAAEVKHHYAKSVHQFYLDHMPTNASHWEDLSEAGPVSTQYMTTYEGTDMIDQFTGVAKLLYGLHKGIPGWCIEMNTPTNDGGLF